MKTASCTKCPKKFHKPTQTLADQALRMHIGRKHDKSIVANGEHGDHSGVLRQRGNGQLVAVGAKAHGRSHLTSGESEAIVSFIRERHTQYDNKTACFNAALEAAGVAGKIISNSTAVSRYFAKATASAKIPGEKRKYTKRVKPTVQQITVKFCPCCGTNMEAVATGLAMAAHIK